MKELMGCFKNKRFFVDVVLQERNNECRCGSLSMLFFQKNLGMKLVSAGSFRRSVMYYSEKSLYRLYKTIDVFRNTYAVYRLCDGRRVDV